MSRPEQPGGLTRKQLREIRMTGATPIIDPDAVAAPVEVEEPAAPVETAGTPVAVPAADADAAAASSAESSEPEVVAEEPEEPQPIAADAGSEPPSAAEAPEPEAPEPEAPEPDAPEPDAPEPAAESGSAAPAPSLHLPRAAAPVVAPAPRPDAHVDLGVAPLTRRQAREQERIRTASVPVITPDVVAAHSAPPIPSLPTAIAHAPAADDESAPESGATALAELFTTPEHPVSAEDADAEPAVSVPVGAVESAAPPRVAAEPVAEPERAADPEPVDVAETEASADPDVVDRPVLRSEFGSELLSGLGAQAPLAPSFDELIARSTAATGSVVAPNALILSQTPGGAPLDGPVTATGEVLITGTLNLPEGLGSQGHAVGTADGKEADAVLIDGELPPASSPTPIAASAAISTVKGTGEIIRPPAPEKGNRLMLSLAITAGVLAVALVGVLILALVTGVF